MSVEFVHEPNNPAWRIVQAMRRELRRQAIADQITSLGQLSSDGKVVISGLVDLPALANVAELALRKEFGI